MCRELAPGQVGSSAGGLPARFRAGPATLPYFACPSLPSSSRTPCFDGAALGALGFRGREPDVLDGLVVAERDCTGGCEWRPDCYGQPTRCSEAGPINCESLSGYRLE